MNRLLALTLLVLVLAAAPAPAPAADLDRLQIYLTVLEEVQVNTLAMLLDHTFCEGFPPPEHGPCAEPNASMVLDPGHGPVRTGVSPKLGPPVRESTGVSVLVLDQSEQGRGLAADCVVYLDTFERACSLSLLEPETYLVLLERFRVTVRWTIVGGATGPGRAIPLPGGASGLFWFFDVSNVEMIVKVVNGCGLPDFGTFWFFASANTNVEVEIDVLDLETGLTRSYFSPEGSLFEPVADTTVAGCPAP